MILGLTLMNEIEDRLGWRQTESLDDPSLRPDSRKILRLLNRVLRSMQRVDTWPLLREDAELVTVAALESIDYFDLTAGSTTLALGATFTGDLAFDETMTGRAIKLSADPTVYRIVSVESPTSLTLSKPWMGEDQADAELAYFIGQDQYALPADFDRPCGTWESFLEPYGVLPVNPDEFKAIRMQRANAPRVDNPAVFTIYGLTPGENQQVLHLDPFPKSRQILAYSYQKDHPQVSTDSDRVLVPVAKQDAVIEGVLYLATRDYTDDNKVQLVLQDYIRTLNTAAGSKSKTEIPHAISPSGKHRLRARGQWGYGARINWGSLFDRPDRVGFD